MSCKTTCICKIYNYGFQSLLKFKPSSLIPSSVVSPTVCQNIKIIVINLRTSCRTVMGRENLQKVDLPVAVRI